MPCSRADVSDAASMQSPHKHLSTKPSDFWLARGAVLVIVGLQLGIVNDLTVGPRWLAPTLELALLIPLSLATAWTQKAAGRASSDPQWQLVGRDRRRVRMLAILLTGLSTLMNFGALAQLIEAILSGHAGTGRLASRPCRLWSPVCPRRRSTGASPVISRAPWHSNAPTSWSSCLR